MKVRYIELEADNVTPMQVGKLMEIMSDAIMIPFGQFPTHSPPPDERHPE